LVCFVLFCFVLFCFVLFCFVLFCFVLFCFVLLLSEVGMGMGWGGVAGATQGSDTRKNSTHAHQANGETKKNTETFMEAGYASLQPAPYNNLQHHTPRGAHRTPQLYDHAAQWLYHPLRKEHAHADTMDESELLESVKFQFESVRGCMAKVLTCIRGGDGFCLWYGIYM
jgi:hypothetical protein